MYQDIIQRKLKAASELREIVRVNEQPLVQELRDIGVKVDSVWDLVNTRGSYAAAVPILLKHLDGDYIPEVREGIARALAVPEAA